MPKVKAFLVALGCGLLATSEARAALPPPPVPNTVAARYSGPVATTYVVESGDCLSTIAERAGVSLGALEAANPEIGSRPVPAGSGFSSSWDLIYPGDAIKIPAGGHVPSGDGPIRLTAAYYGSVSPGEASSVREAALSLNGAQNWAGWCLKMVATAFARAGHAMPELAQGCAFDAYLVCKREGLIHDDLNAPAGAVVFYDWSGYAGDPPVWGEWGHVAISNGDGTVITTTGGANMNPAFPINGFATCRYLGWVAPTR